MAQANQREGQAWDGAQNRPLLERQPPLYRDRDEPPRSSATAYRTFVGPGTVFSGPGNRPIYGVGGVPDGLSNTLLAVEAAGAVPWSKPDELTVTPGRLVDKLGKPGHDYFLAVMMDGSVRAVKKTVSDQTLRRAIDPQDGTPLGADW